MPHSAHPSAKSGTADGGDEHAITGESSAGENNPPQNGTSYDTVDLGAKGKKRKRKRAPKTDNGVLSTSRRRLSVSKPARDPRDEAAASALEPLTETRSPSPVIDFDGLSRPSMSRDSHKKLCKRSTNILAGRGTRERREESPKQAAARLEKMAGAVRTILECIGEDPNREGLLKTPERYAKALLGFTQGYQQNVKDIVNDAIFHEDHNELVIVKDIEVFSLCEHHMVPFTGKVYIYILSYSAADTEA